MNFSAKNSVSIHLKKPLAGIRVTGEDAAQFLQGQFTNDLSGGVGSAVYGLWLNQKGKVLADSHILRVAEREFVVLSIDSVASVILQRLEQYVIADDVVLEDQTSAMSAVAIWGEGTAKVLQDAIGVAPVAGRFVEAQCVVIFPGQPLHAESFWLVGADTVISGLQAKLVGLGAREVNESEAQCARIGAGVPSIPGDVGPTDLPQEAGLEDSAISFTKGCYLGQEVMARLKNLGQVRRLLRKVRGTGVAPAHGSPLFQGPKKVGEMRSAVATPEGFVGLAMLTRLGLDEGGGFSLEGESGTPRITVWTN